MKPKSKFYSSNVARFGATLRKMLNSEESENSKPADRKTAGKSRKEARKEERKFKKRQRLAFSKHQHVPTKTDVEKEKALVAKKEKMKLKRKRLKQNKKVKLRTQKREKEEKEKQREDDDKADEKEIKMLEKQLKMNKKKKSKLPTSFKNDGLDYILDAVDDEKLKLMYDAESSAKLLVDPDADGVESIADEAEEDVEDISEDGESEDDLEGEHEDDMSDEDANSKEDEEEDNDEAIYSDADDDMMLSEEEGDNIGDESANDEEEEEELEEEVEDEGDDEEEEEEQENDEEEDNDEVDDELKEECEDEGNEEMDHENDELEAEVDATDTSLKEDIYGRLRTKDGDVIKAYIPPALRKNEARSSAKAEELLKIGKQIKGLLNRVSEANLPSICKGMEDLYGKHARGDVTQQLEEVLEQSLVRVTPTSERLITENCLVVAFLYHKIGVEVGASILQKFAIKFDSLLTAQDADGSKEVQNALLVILNLYNLKLVQGKLVFDLIRRLLNPLGSLQIELLLVLLRTSGFTLRKDDPQGLKNVINDIQSETAKLNQQGDARLRFMLDVLLAVRNNNVRKIPHYDAEALERARKLQRHLVEAREDMIRVGLEELLQSAGQGRWWLVGSAWTGNHRENDVTTEKKEAPELSEELVALAKKHRMNTSIRMNIFIILVTAEDFVDAFEKLLKLSLSHKQEREIIYVLVEMCFREKEYNPYYSVICQKFCEFDRRFVITFQFHMWDKFKDMESLKKRQLANFTQLILHMITSRAISLSILKGVDFAQMNKAKLFFLKELSVALLMKNEEKDLIDIFTRISDQPKLQQMREGLALFLKHFFKKQNLHIDDSIDRTLLLHRIAKVEKILSKSKIKNDVH